MKTYIALLRGISVGGRHLLPMRDMDIPDFRLHPLKGKLKGRWSIWVNGNWRNTFEFKDSNAFILDYGDYH